MADHPSTGLTGGGKIRLRRGAAARKPYSRSSSPQKSLFSRVTDSVKSLLNPITPKWLANRLEHQSPESPQNQDSEEEPSTSLNHQESYNRKNNNYKLSPLCRPPLNRTAARVSMSPTQRFVTPPDTPSPVHQISSSGANIGKEGLIKHLTMASKRAKVQMDSPALSDSSYLRNEMKFLSTNDDASVASSSDSLPSGQVGSQSTNTSDNKPVRKSYWSTSMDSLTPDSWTSSRQQAKMSNHKRPRFNPAIFGMPASDVDRSPILHKSSSYEGSVQFGGANASGRSPYLASPYKIPCVTKVKVRHVNHQSTRARSSASSRSSKIPMDESSTQGMSSTAKKVLQTLEKMSSPLNDARKISTMIRTPSSFAADRRKRRMEADSSIVRNSPPSVGLATPSSAKRKSDVPSNNSLLVKKTGEKRKEEDVTTPQQSELPGPSKVELPDSKVISIRGLPAPIASMSSSAYVSKVKSPPFGNGKSGVCRKIISQKRTSSHFPTVQEEDNETSDLPNVPLPVSSLPSCNFGNSIMTSTPAVRPQERNDRDSSKQPEFSFASPLVKTAHTEQAQSSADDTPKFQFSSPAQGSSLVGESDTPRTRTSSSLSAGSKPGTSTLIFTPDPKIVSAVKASKRRSSPLSMPNSENSRSGLGPAEQLKKGSVMDMLGDGAQYSKGENTSSATKSQSLKLPPLEQSKSGGWTCAVCMLPNDDTANSCVACTSPRPNAEKKPPLSNVFSKNKGWDCGTCMVPNDPDVEKCVACETPKPGSSTTANASKTFGTSSIFKTGTAAPQTQKFSFGFTLKKDTDSMAESDGSLSQQFKKPEGTWECGICLVRNHATSTKCEACQTIKLGCTTSTSSTGVSSAPTKTGFKFGLPSSSSSLDASTKTSGSSSAWECEVCMVSNTGERRTCETCDSPKPGTKKVLSTSFKFGENSSGLLKFGIPDNKTIPSEENEDSQQDQGDNVQTGTPVSQNKLLASDAAPAKLPFSFGLPTKVPTLSNDTASETKTKTTATTFSFGQKSDLTEPAQKRNVPDAETKAPSFTFDSKKEHSPAPAESSKPPAFGASASAGFSFISETRPSVKPDSDAAKPTPQQAQSTSINPLLGRLGNAPASEVAVPEVASQVRLGVSGTSTYQPPSFGQQTETSKTSQLPTYKRPSFGQQTDTSQPATYQRPSFGQQTEKSQPATYQRPSFGQQTETSQPTNYQRPSFGQQTETSQPATYQRPSFGQQTETSQPTTYQRPSFGQQTETSQPATYQRPSFGQQTETSQPTTYQRPSFGQHTETSQPATYQRLSFGQQTETSQPPLLGQQTEASKTSQPPTFKSPSLGQQTEITKTYQPPSFGQQTDTMKAYQSPSFGQQTEALKTSQPPNYQLPSFVQTTDTLKAYQSSSFGQQTDAMKAYQSPSFGQQTETWKTSQPPNYQSPSFGQHTETSKPPEQKSTVTQSFKFGDKPAGAFQFSGSSEPSNPAVDASAGAKLFGFGVAKQTEEGKSQPSFGFTQSVPTANNPPQFSRFGGPAQQTNQLEPKKTEAPKPGFSFTGNQIAALQSSGGIFGSSSANVASPFAAPSSKSSFGAGSSAALTPFDNQGGPGSTTSIFQRSGSLNTGFGAASKPTPQSSSTSGNIFGSDANTNSVFRGTQSSNASSSIPKPTFPFGASNTEQAKNKPPGGFTFTGTTPQSAGFQFGAATQQGNPTLPSTTSQFGAAPSKPTFNAATVAPASGFPFGGQSGAQQSNGVFQFGAGNSQSNLDSSGGNNIHAFGSNNSNNPGGSSSSTGFNFAGSHPSSSFNFTGAQPNTTQAGFSMGEAPPNQNPFRPQTQDRRKILARRKVKK